MSFHSHLVIRLCLCIAAWQKDLYSRLFSFGVSEEQKQQIGWPFVEHQMLTSYRWPLCTGRGGYFIWACIWLVLDSPFVPFWKSEPVILLEWRRGSQHSLVDQFSKQKWRNNSRTKYCAEPGDQKLEYFESDSKGPQDVRFIALNALEAAIALYSTWATLVATMRRGSIV